MTTTVEAWDCPDCKTSSLCKHEVAVRQRKTSSSRQVSTLDDFRAPKSSLEELPYPVGMPTAEPVCCARSPHHSPLSMSLVRPHQKWGPFDYPSPQEFVLLVLLCQSILSCGTHGPSSYKYSARRRGSLRPASRSRTSILRSN